MAQPKYRIEIFWSDEDGGYIANVPDLRYCSAFGETYEEALREVLEAMDLHLDTLRELGRPIPEASSSAVSWASETFADAIRESYEALADRSVSAQELNAQLTQEFFNGVINNLRTQAESNRTLAEGLIEQQRKQQEASQALTQESMNAYTEFLNSMFSFYRGSLDKAQRSPRQ